MPDLKTVIEAILYLKGQPLELGVLAQLANCSRAEAQEAVLELMDDYAHRDSALEVVQVGKAFSLQLRPPLASLAERLLPPELGRGSLRTLAAIILKGPLSLADLVQLRGAGAYQHVSELVAKGFVKKERQPGSRSPWLRVTPKFQDYFVVDNLAATWEQGDD
ncbi:MAG: SMC-Scp complex subunit ScpB [Thermostichales cyanobacterium SZTDM-1c_bins_54]